MSRTKIQLQQDLESLKRTSEGMQEGISVDKVQVMKLLQSFEDLDNVRIKQLIEGIDNIQNINFKTFQEIIDELINMVSSKEDIEIAQVLESKELEIKNIMVFFKEELDALKQKVEMDNSVSTQELYKIESQVEIASVQSLKTLFAQEKERIKGKKLFGLFRIEGILEGFEKLVLKEAQGIKLSWWEKLKKWGYTFILGLVSGDLIRKTKEALESIKDPIKAIKDKFGPETIEQYKQKLGEMFLGYLEPVIPANLSPKIIEEKWQRIWNNMWEKYERVLIKTFPQDGNLSKLNPSDVFALGGMFAFDLTKNLWEQGLISIKQLGVRLVKEGGSYAFHMSIKGAQMIGGIVIVGLGKITLDDWRNLISMEGESAKAKAVWSYRLMETWIGEILKFGAKLSGYALSSVASLDDISAKFKVFVDMWNGEGEFVFNQLEELAKLSGEGSGDFKRFKDLIKQVQESVAVYNAAKFAKTQNQFEKNLRRFLPPEEVRKVIKSIEKSGGDDFFKKVGNYLVGEAEKIKNVDSVVPKALLENVGIKWKASDLRSIIHHLGDVVEESGRMIISKETILGKLTGLFRKTEVAGKTVIVVDAKTLNSSSKDLRGALKLALKQSPHLFSEFLGLSPIFLLTGLEIQECEDEKCSPEKLLGSGLDVMIDLIPIVGPLRFLWGNKKGAENLRENISQYVAGFGWLGLDTRYFVRNVGKKGLAKSVIDAFLEPARVVGKAGRFVGRSAAIGSDLLKALGSDLKNLKFITFKRTLNQGWEFVRSARGGLIGIAIASIFVGIEAYGWLQDKQKINKFKRLLEKISASCDNQNLGECEKYLRERFANSKDDIEKLLITSVLVYQNFGVSPQGVEVQRDENNRLKIVFNGYYNLSDLGNPFVSEEIDLEEIDKKNQKEPGEQNNLWGKVKDWALQIIDGNERNKIYKLTPLARQIRDYVEFLWGKEVYVKIKGNNINPFVGRGNNTDEVLFTQTSS